MAMTKMGAGGGKSTRSEVVSVRFDPKLRYLAELAARKHRRSVSSYVEWAVENSLKSVVLYDGSAHMNDTPATVDDESQRLWDVSEPERLMRLAILYPELLNIDEQQIWKLIQDSGLLSPAKRRDSEGDVKWIWPALEDLVFPEVRRNWPEIKGIVTEGSLADRNSFVDRIKIGLSTGTLYQEP